MNTVFTIETGVGMDIPDTPRVDLYEQAQHLYRRHEELEARVGSLCRTHLWQVTATLDVWSNLDPVIAELVYSLIELRIDELALVEQLGPGWRTTDSGIAYSPMWAGEVAPDA